MKLFSLPSSSLIILPSSSTKVVLEKHSALLGHASSVPNISRRQNAKKHRFPDFRAQPSVSAQARGRSNLVLAQATKQDIQPKDENLVFVAGATGKVGSRTVRELLKLGFQVRAGVRSAKKAETLVQSVRQLKLEEGPSAVEKLEVVECDLEKDRIESAIGNASVVICCIGASEKEVFDITGPYRIDYQATKNLIDAATVVGVDQFILLTSLGTNKVGFPAAILNLFWGVLVWKRKAEEALIASGLPYTIVRPGGMERPTDAYKETHNVTVAKEDTLFGGQVSNLQVAELMAYMAKDRSASYCKVVEVVAETTAPLKPFGELLSKIPSERVYVPPKEPRAVPTPDPAPPQSVVPEATSSSIDKEPIPTKVQTTTSLSPYAAYEDLKPPTSPIPTPTTSRKMKDVDAESTSGGISNDLKPPTSPTPTLSGGMSDHANISQAVSESSASATQINILEPLTEVTDTSLASVVLKETRPLSPYTVYEDLKPPISPIPIPSGPKRETIAADLPIEAVPSSTDGSAVTGEIPKQVVEKDLPENPNIKSSHLSPYHMYDDLKPPASPSPSAPTFPLPTSTAGIESQIPSMLDSSTPQLPISRPLSPFAMYDDLKPPSSPMPSPRNIKHAYGLSITGMRVTEEEING